MIRAKAGRAGPSRFRSAAFLILGLLAMVPARPASAQEPGPDLPGRQPGRLASPEMATVPSDIRDAAGMFSEGAVKKARTELVRIEKLTGSPVLIETIGSLEGEGVDQVAARLARRAGTQGIFVLMSRKDSKLEVLPSQRYADAMNRPARDKVRAAFISAFREKRFDDGLARGIAAIEAELTAAKKLGKVPPAEQPEPDGRRPTTAFLPQADASMPAGAPATGRDDPHRPEASSSTPPASATLVVRNQTRLTLEGARLIIASAKGKAIEMNLKINVAVVDDGGHLLSFDRMDGARTVSAYTAITKATSAATLRRPTGPVTSGGQNPDPLLNLSLEHAAAASGGTMTTLLGGIPITVDNQVIGAVGVGGNSGEQDAEVARAAAKAFLEAVQKPQPAPASPTAPKAGAASPAPAAGSGATTFDSRYAPVE